MPLTIVNDHARQFGYPAVLCDWCGQRITDVDDGNVYWLHAAPTTTKALRLTTTPAHHETRIAPAFGEQLRELLRLAGSARRSRVS